MSTEDNNRFVLIGDIVGSRAMPDDTRKLTQESFSGTIHRLNEAFAAALAAKFRIIAGDETQGLLYEAEPVFDIVRGFQVGLWPAQIVFGIGFGAVDAATREYADQYQGPAFRLAEQALTAAKAERKSADGPLLREVRFATADRDRDNILNGLFLALAVIKNQWTEKQCTVFHQLEKGMDIDKMAERLRIAATGITTMMIEGRFHEYVEITQSVRDCLRALAKRTTS